ncbi:hypothetical protein H5410_030293 [Solanum commersonii]|uniref:Uncharacterized protein n=1 Tax=Solanum commersonii TaxID=4109 RepID=A0A9J5YDX0_SOLCO|nr:hypothetical protein H5410_030293 [Solanum commersonii]
MHQFGDEISYLTTEIGVQIVDMTRERESLEKSIKFQNLILKDEKKKVTRVVSESSNFFEEIHS